MRLRCGNGARGEGTALPLPGLRHRFLSPIITRNASSSRANAATAAHAQRTALAAALDLTGQVAVITGAGAGIGRACAERLAEAGATVVVSDLRADNCAAVAAHIAEGGGVAIGVPCDVTDEAARQGLLEAAIQRFQKVAILVNNAGGGGPQAFDMPLSTFERAFELNVFSTFRMCQLFAPHMEAAGGGAIVNITSMAGENTNRRMASYASSKAAENHLTRNLAFDLGPRGIRVNAVAPGAVRTAALQTVLTPEIEAAMLRHTPLGRLGEPQDISNAVLFLASPLAGWVSGQVLTVNGGGSQELD